MKELSIRNVQELLWEEMELLKEGKSSISRLNAMTKSAGAILLYAAAGENAIPKSNEPLKLN